MAMLQFKKKQYLEIPENSNIVISPTSMSTPNIRHILLMNNSEWRHILSLQLLAWYEQFQSNLGFRRPGSIRYFGKLTSNHWIEAEIQDYCFYQINIIILAKVSKVISSLAKSRDNCINCMTDAAAIA